MAESAQRRQYGLPGFWLYDTDIHAGLAINLQGLRKSCESGFGYLLAPFVAISVDAQALRDKMSKMSQIRMAALAIIVTTVVCLLRESGELPH